MPTDSANAPNRRDLLKAAGAGAITLLASNVPGIAAEASVASRPNIVFVLLDDVGYGAFGCHGDPIVRTPNIDRLHSQSVRFADFHVSPTCSPTRAALLTGRHEFKSGVTHTILERERLSLKPTTLAELLKRSGYRTGIFGKWHLGDEPERWPDKRGFEEMFIHGGGGIGQSYPGTCGDAPGNMYMRPVILHNGTFEKTEGFCTDVFFDRAIKWIDRRRGGREPFFCCITPNAAHAPWQCPQEYLSRYQGRKDAAFYGLVENIDDNVGRLLSRLKEWDLDRDTLLVFMTDNGAAGGVNNCGMRGQKGTVFYGGTRVPSFWRWTGTLKEGVDVEQMTCHWDFFPTIAQIAGAKIEGDLAGQVEGRSLWPLLLDRTAPWADRYFFTHLGRWAQFDEQKCKHAQCSVRWRDYQLVSTGKPWQLYDLKADFPEKRNIAGEQPQIVAQLSGEYDKWWASIIPCLENEGKEQKREANPFRQLYWKQYGGPGPNNVPPPKDAARV